MDWSTLFCFHLEIRWKSSRVNLADYRVNICILFSNMSNEKKKYTSIYIYLCLAGITVTLKSLIFIHQNEMLTNCNVLENTSKNFTMFYRSQRHANSNSVYKYLDVIK